ncbi:DUF2147 domain-containing protein [Solirhodobacter olei]|uniref:DUF2147 domain-containing protein n=1 Tax=Solirhodobacter olei TaxID=2493082 RepID=UPI000FDC35A3|nr:DUF2147 domain-containing protein [Solirhodobacter olei]
MKRLLIVALALAIAAPAFAADPVVGIWKSKPDDNGNFGYIRVAPCGARICGVLIKSFDKAGKPMASPNIGRKIVWDMKAEGGGAYGAGKIWAPDRNQTYASKMELKGDVLTVKGCALFGLVCRGQDWTRVK